MSTSRMIPDSNMKNGKLHSVGTHAASVRTYSRLTADCGRDIKITPRKGGEPALPIGIPYDPQHPDLCKTCQRLQVEL